MIVLTILLFIIFLISELLFISEIWLFRTWGDVLTVDEIIYHLTASFEGTNPDMVISYLIHYGSIVLLIAVVMIILLVLCRRKKRKLYKLLLLGMFFASAALLAVTVYRAENTLGAVSYIYQQMNGTEEDYVADHYVDTSWVDLTFPETKQNLIFIFMESTEITYADEESGGAFEENVIPELTELALENETFNGDSGVLNGGYSLPGSNWTMGALFAQTSGLPLKIPLYGNDMSTQDTFFPGVTTLGDILEQEGYRQVFMLGSNAAFGGRDLYYEEHGDFEILDYNWAIDEGKIPSDYYEFWGYEDEKLFAYAREELETLASSEEPFHLTLLTVDTHFEDGYLCDLCEDEFGDNQYANVFACSSRQVTEFVEWIETQDFYENTTIVISGDHPTMDTDFCEDVDDSYDRKTYFTIIHSAQEASIEARTFSTMDIFPTTLAAMGVEIPGGQLAMGVNLYDTSVATLLETEGLEAASTGLNQTSALMNSLSEVTITDETMETLREVSDILPYETEKGTLGFEISDIYLYLNINAVEKVTLKVSITNFTTAETEHNEYEAEIVEEENDSNTFHVIVETDIPYDEVDLAALSGNAYIWVDGYEEFALASIVQEGTA